MPLFGGRDFKLLIGQDVPPSKNHLTAHIDYVSTELGQVGTQLDGLGHVGIGDIYYNGNNRKDFASRTGLKKLGVENAGPFITRGVMIDVAAYKGVERLNSGYEVTLADVKGALARQDVTLREGDSVFLRTGWAQLWMKDNATHIKGEPGWGPEVCNWLVQQKPAMTGCDTWGCDVVSNHLIIPRAEMMHVFGPAIEELVATLSAQGMPPTGSAFAHHLKMSPDTFDFEVGFTTAAPITPTGRVKLGHWPATKVARTVYHGPYDGLPSAWGEFDAWMKANGLAQAEDLWEHYVTGPHSSPDPATWRTELNRPLVG